MDPQQQIGGQAQASPFTEAVAAQAATTPNTHLPTETNGGPTWQATTPPRSAEATLTGTLIGGGHPDQNTWPARLSGGLALAALFGLALGARDGGSSLLSHALFVPAGLLMVALVGVPALMIALALFNSPVRGMDMLEGAVSAVGSAGLLLAGLAPATAFFVVTSQGDGTVSAIASLGLTVAGSLALHRMFRAMDGPLTGGGLITAGMARSLFAGFCLFSVLFAGRLWASTLPVFGGAA